MWLENILCHVPLSSPPRIKTCSSATGTTALHAFGTTLCATITAKYTILRVFLQYMLYVTVYLRAQRCVDSLFCCCSLAGSLPRPKRAAALQRYGKLLITNRPEDTTSLLMDLCIPPTPGSATITYNNTNGSSSSSSISAAVAGIGSSSSNDADFVASVADFSHLYSERPTMLKLLCEFILGSQASPPSEQLLYHTLLELYLTPLLVDEVGEFHTEGQEEGEEEAQSLRAAEVRGRMERVGGWMGGAGGEEGGAGGTTFLKC